MVILIFNWRDPKHPKSGGAEIATLKHALGWVKAGHKVFWFSVHFSNVKSYEKFQGIHIYRKGNAITLYLQAFLFYQQRKHMVDIVVDEIHGIPFFTPLYVKKPKIAFINEVAGVIWDAMYPFPFNLSGKFFEPILLQLYKNTPIMTGSESARNDLLTIGFSKKNITIIHHGVDIFPVDSSIKKEQTPTFIFVNRLVKMKGIEHVILAFASIQKQIKNATLWIAGKGEENYLKKLQHMIKKMHIQKNIVFFGYVNHEQKFNLLKRAHILLHASVKEGWGLNVIEAASQGTPTVAYNVGGLVDSIQDRKTGILTKKNTPENLAKDAVVLVQDQSLYSALQKNAIKWSKHFSWEKSIQESLALLENVSNNN